MKIIKCIHRFLLTIIFTILKKKKRHTRVKLLMKQPTKNKLNKDESGKRNKLEVQR